MIHSIYTRLVLAFIAVVLASTFITFTIVGTLYREEGWRYLQSDIRDTGKQVIELYSLREKINFDEFLQKLARLNNVRISLHSADGVVKSYQDPEVDAIEPLNPQMVESVLGGNEYSGKNQLDQSEIPENTVVGLPFFNEGERYAVFVQPIPGRELRGMNKILIVTLLFVLLIGSLLILMVARYLVKPITSLTEATKRLAKGDYQIDLQMKRRDELGNLTENFSMMAKQLEQIEKMRSDFVNNVSHEMQSPLTSIRGFSKALLEDTDPVDPKYRFAEIIYNESTRLSRLCANLLQLASLESKHHPFKKVPYYLDEQIRQTVVALEPQWSQKNLDVHVDLPWLQIEADLDQLSQVWMNLITNSIKFSKPAGAIWIRMTTKDGSVTVSLEDQGSGIAKEDLPHIFDRFYKGDKSRERVKSGSGLGLSIAKKIIEIHGGQITVQSTLDKGTVFNVTLPLPPRGQKLDQ
ncbi:sensor histidine kinase [Brevibacillus nitrificans]|uniref:Heme sensor protein HssS n=1 Tax=Brevibacillus nitrificans TaxID=651560 RepID=A0A3M8D8Z8_9BACL|nr:HAMP domain-containing sensor histidine kinase [Brevibacillus nitrificans]RNB84051.1 sensor histidine kinase [Brevibacillus nitrificans]